MIFLIQNRKYKLGSSEITELVFKFFNEVDTTGREVYKKQKQGYPANGKLTLKCMKV